MYLTANYQTHQFQLAPIFHNQDISSDLRPFKSTNCNETGYPPRNDSTASTSLPITKTHIGMIVIGCVLAVALVAIVWLYIQLKHKRFSTAHDSDQARMSEHNRHQRANLTELGGESRRSELDIRPCPSNTSELQASSPTLTQQLSHNSLRSHMGRQFARH